MQPGFGRSDTATQGFTDVTQQLSGFFGLGDVQTAFGLPAHSLHPVQVRAIKVLQGTSDKSQLRGCAPVTGQASLRDVSPHFVGNKPFWPAGP